MQNIKFEKIPSGIFDKVKNNKEEFVEKFIDELKELFPETVKDGKVDFQALLERFGEYQDDDERYELTWVGKNKARQESFEDIVGRTLKYIEEDSKNPETTENLYIEGDNLEVLKLLRNSYYGKIKMIYIDPPYNTGSDFVYKDDFSISKEEYDKLKGDIDDYGERLVKNDSDSGRYHSNWLNMMYPRLQVAKDLLTDDGVIFISIDDNEVHNMRKICDEIFGKQNFLSNIIRVTGSTRAMAKNFDIRHDYVLSYSKNIKNINLKELKNKKTNKFKNWDNDSKGNWDTQDLTVRTGGYSYKIPSISLEKNFLRNWRYSEKNLKEKMGFEEIDSYEKIYKHAKYIPEKGWYTLGEFVFKGKDNIINHKKYKDKVNTLKNHTLPKNVGSNKSGGKQVRDLFGINKDIFDKPKPVELLTYLSFIGTNKNSLVLDFFSGSATTAHAVMDLNADDGGNRKFIMVQLPEPTDEKSEAYNAGYKNICEIGKERIRRAGEKIKEEYKDKEGIEDLDTGFKVFRVDNTNFRRIKEIEGKELEDKFKSMNYKDREDFNPHFTDLDVVYELMLRRQDIELTEEIKKLDNIGDRTYIVGDTMLVCLEEKITEQMVEDIGNINTDLSWIVLRDSAFDDNCELKINTTNKLRSIIKNSRRKDQKIYWI